MIHSNRSENPPRRGGFTLVEIMVVVIVVAILAVTIIPQFGDTLYDAKVSTARSNMASIKSALERFNLHMDRYPSTSEGLQALVEKPDEGGSIWRGAYVQEMRPDPWGNPYMYKNPSSHGSKPYDIWSRGADNADGGEGKNADISSWKTQEPGKK